MKSLFTFLLAALAFVATAQTTSIPYQAVAQNSSGKIWKNTSMGLRLSIVDSSVSGIVRYQETQFIQTDKNGLFSVSIR